MTAVVEPLASQVMTCCPWQVACPGTHLVQAGIDGAHVRPLLPQSCIDCQLAASAFPTQACSAVP